jgi:hypothetical protein
MIGWRRDHRSPTYVLLERRIEPWLLLPLLMSISQILFVIQDDTVAITDDICHYPHLAIDVAMQCRLSCTGSA